MAKTGAVSVIIPFYNRVNYLEDALRSVFFQTGGDIQLILADDGSNDGSLERALDCWKRLSAEHPSPGGERELASCTLEHSGMPGLVRNRAAGMAGADLLAFLDSDDYWLPEKLALQLPLHRRTAGRAPFLISHTREQWLRMTGDGSFREISQKSQRHQRRGDLFSDSLWKCIIGPSTTVIDREFFLSLGGFREDINVAEDYEFWLRVTAGVQVGYIDTPCTVKRAGMAGQDQLSERYGQIEGFRIKALKELLDQFEAHFTAAQRREALTVLGRKAEIYAQGAKKRGRMAEYEDMIALARRCTQRSTEQ